MNLLIITGNVVKEPELRYTQDQKAVLGFTLANNQGFGDKKHTEYYDCSIWGKRAESLQPHITGGQSLTVQGEHRTHKREHNGKDYFHNKLFVREVELGSRPQGGQSSGHSQGAPAHSAPAEFDDPSDIAF